MDGLRIFGSPPETQELADALLVAAEALDQNMCYALDGRFHFTIEGGWTVAISADSAERLRVETCRLSIPRAAMWVLADKHDRLVGLVSRMRNDVLELV
jgi:hypothetical protein